MASANNINRLSNDEWNELQRRADQFAEALSKDMAADWSSFLANLDDRMRLAVLAELVKIDLENRWSHGEKPLIDEYIQRFPELGPLHAVSPDLICEEYRLRRKHNQHPDRDEYKERFPAQFEAIVREIEREVPKTLGPERTDGSVRAQTIVSSASEKSKVAASVAKNVSEISTGYHKIEMIGEGHFAEVWRAKAPGGVEIAIKVVRQPIDRDAAQRELSALEIIKDLRHPCLLTTFQFWIQERKLHIAMELADGTLRNRMQTCKKQGQPGIPRDELLMYFADAAEGLDFLHSHKVFHRDIKPDNIMLLQGHAKVADFGLSRMQEKQMATVSFAGTPVYMAPEAWGGKGGPRSDQYSLAFAYAELRQGKRPVEGDDFTTVMSRVLEGEPDFTNIPYEEVKILKKAMAKRPEDRFGSCSEFVAAMARATGTPVRTRTKIEVDLRNRGSDGSNDTYKEPSSENIDLDGGGKKKKWMVALGVGVLLVGISFGVWQLFIRDSSSPTTGQQQQGPAVVDIGPSTTDQKKIVVIDDKKPPVESISPLVFVLEVRKVFTDLLDRLYVPRKFTPERDAQFVLNGNRLLADRVGYPFGDERAVFILLRPAGGKPFYMMENKVWCGFLKAFDKEIPGKLDGEKWKNDNPKWPAFDMSVTAAKNFAEWLGGQLPTVNQWDFAAGVQDKKGVGPNRRGSAAVARTEPRAIDDKERDEGPFGILDLSGNGREFTRNVKRANGDGFVPLEKVTDDDGVIVRGRDYTTKTPLTYKQLADMLEDPLVLSYTARDKVTSFRVVIEIPE